MAKNTGTIKEYNQNRILKLLGGQCGMTKQEISVALQLSMPTTLQNVNEMMDQGILEEGGMIESTGGRRAKKIQLNRDAGYCIGIDIATNCIGFVLVNLKGEVIGRKSILMEFQDDPMVYDQINKELGSFLKGRPPENKILGAGISFPGIIDMEAGWIVKSHIFDLEYVSLDRFQKIISYPMIVENDANCMSYAELSSEQTDYVYISLNRTVGGSVVQNGKLTKGEGFRAGEVGHMILVPEGEACYCGKRGCADAYLSAKVLMRNAKSLEDFFASLEGGEKNAVKVWSQYLDYLALLVTNLRMVLDQKIIIGGEIGSYIEPYMGELCRKASEYDWFARDIDYIEPCRQTEMAGAVGAALLALEEFGSGVLR